MEDANLNITKGRGGIASIAVVGIAAFATAFAIFELFAFPSSLLFVLLLSIFVASVAARYEARIPYTTVEIRPKDLLTFWGIIWLGIPGGILIGLTASWFAQKTPRPTSNRVVGAGIDVISSTVSAIVFSSLLSALRSSATFSYPDFVIIPVDILAAACLLGLTHFAVRYVLSSIAEDVETNEGEPRPISDSVVSTTASYTIHLLSTVLLFAIFNHFGIEFGLVVLPLVVIGHISFTIHERTLAAKTKLISEASKLHLATVEALATAIDARDQVGMGHVRRTQIYALGIGKAMGLSESDLDALRMGALLHDIGKLAVPDHILNKPGRLTPAEFEKTKIHASVGASILETISFPYPVAATVKYHHENWDGTGYPHGLRGNAIPLTARILSVADVYDTLRGARPYRTAISADRVVQMLQSNSGSKFDPQIVDVLITDLPTLESEIRSLGIGYDVGSDSGTFIVSPADVDVSPNYVQQIKRANREVFTLYSLAKEFGAAADLDDSLALLTEKVRELAPYDTCVVYLLDKTGESAVARHVAGANQEDLLSKSVIPGEGATGYVLKARHSVQNVDPALDFAFSDAEFSRDYIAMASLPLVSDDGIVGAVSLYSRTIACYSDEHIRLLETVARIATDAIIRSQQLEEAETYALTDPLTGLTNSRGLQAHFDKEAKRADRNDSGFQMLVLDLDGFKAINDTHGHKIGDTMLREIANVIKGQLREYDLLARYGGDEFVAIIPGTETIDVLELSRRIEKSVCDFKMKVDASEMASVGISIGSANYPTQGSTFDQIVIAADKAMYITKAIHRQERTVSKRPRKNESREFLISSPELAAEFKPLQEILEITDEGLVLELDDSHIIASSAIN